MMTFCETRRVVLMSRLAVFALAASALAVGCNDGRPGRVHVTGIVNYRGKPVEGASVTFTPKGNRPAAGQTDAAGRFTLASFTPDDGAVVGEHVVCIAKFVPDPKDKSESLYPKRILALPARYATTSQSPLRATVTERGPNEFRFDLTE